ncbi:SRPBCC domain-containing protein [Hyphomonas sp. WL0036]|uniref:SRPBCC family protein n=1 Tax=Hyphomonas sediminis TaxID=2866160 RepID=UPI001C7E44E8|nr:SRPBCC domain-containing protein [Hyphomonas sediminis]MBY9066266.1 SRPBCC domain-containing protein [Hyphomonas sediminis]
MTQTRSIVIERDIAHPPEKIWRALTTPHLIEDWLMKNEFAPITGHRFQLRADWGTVDCEVLTVEPGRTLAYSWNAGDDATGLRSTVIWTLAPTPTGTRLRMEQSGFRKGQPHYYGGAMAGWPRMIDALEAVAARAA